MFSVDENLMARKRELAVLLVTRVKQYFAVMNAPCPKAVLTRSFSKRALSSGGLESILSELLADGSLECALTRNGGYLFYPGGQALKLPEGARLIR